MNNKGVTDLARVGAEMLPEVVATQEGEGSSKIVRLRSWLKCHAPHLLTRPWQEVRRSRTGVRELDQQVGAVWPECGLVEWVRADDSSGATALLWQVAIRRAPGLIGWVDLDQFDPVSCPPGLLSRLFWVRGKDALEVVRAGELLVRDGNFDLVVLDLGERWWRSKVRVPSTVWSRLGQVARGSGCLVVVITPTTRVSGARLRLRMSGRRRTEDVDADFGEERVARVTAVSTEPWRTAREEMGKDADLE